MSTRDIAYVWRRDYAPRFTTKNGEANRRTYEALSQFIAKNGPQTQDALEAHARQFHWHHQYGVNVPGGIEYVRWHISHGNLIPIDGSSPRKYFRLPPRV